jgi:uncharacterized membrane protein HdeD (DUF308 family)
MGGAQATTVSGSADGRLRTAFAVLGSVALLAGLAALVLPHATVIAVVWLFGIYLVVAGGALFVRAVTADTSTWLRIGLGVVGVLIVCGGVFAIAHPPVGIRWVALATGFAWILEGIALLYAPAAGSRALTVVGAALSILSGLLIINVPYLGAVFAVVAVASVLIVSGVVQLVVAVTWTRSGTRDEDGPATV